MDDDDIDYYPRAGKRTGRAVKQETEKGEYTKQVNHPALNDGACESKPG